MKKIIGIIVCVATLMCLCLTACAAQPKVSEGSKSVTITGIEENDLAIAAVYDENMVLTGVKIYRDRSDVSVDYTDFSEMYEQTRSTQKPPLTQCRTSRTYIMKQQGIK